MRKINEIIIHCSASDSRNYDHKAISIDHTRNRGWSAIGYHYVVDYSGKINIGRPIKTMGAHCKGKNRNSIGICVLGLSSFSSEQKEELAKLCRNLCVVHGLTHKDINPHNLYNQYKSCPNFDLDEWKRDYFNGV